MDVTINTLKRQIQEYQKQIQDLQASLTEERVSNLEFDQTQKEQKIKIEELTDLLGKEKLKNQALSQQIQELQIQNDENKQTIHNYQQYIAQKHQQLIVQNNIINQLQQNIQQMSDNGLANEDDNDDKGDTTELRHRLLEEQMRHDQLKDIHRQSITKLEHYELQQLQEYNNNKNANDNDDTDTDTGNVNTKLKEEIASLRRQLEDEKKRRENLDKERRNSLASLSQNMFKKLLDSEHQHYDDKSDLEKQCNQLKLIIRHLEKSKQTLLQETSGTINDLRDAIKLLSSRLRRYENWD